MESGRKVFLLGKEEGIDEIEAGLRSFSFVQVIRTVIPPADLAGLHFLVSALDFRDPSGLQHTCRIMDGVDGSLCQRVGYFFHPNSPSKMELLFAVELGCRFFARGEDRLDQLKKYLQSAVSMSGRLSELQRCEEEMRRQSSKGDMNALATLADEVAEIGKDSEDGLRLQVEIQRLMRKKSRIEPLLRKILMKYPENLWAANQLGKHLLSTGKAAEAIEILGNLSFFHELNGERLLALGQAYVDSGIGKEAEATFRKVEKLAPEDQRVKDGLIKAKLVQNDFGGLEVLAKNGEMNADVISFLNMRAIMAIRAGEIDGGMRLYQFALAKSTRDELVQSKLFFNVGLAQTKKRDFKSAVESFERSKKLGGIMFDRAAKPLGIARKLAATATPSHSPKGMDEVSLDDIEWEQVDNKGTGEKT